MRARLPLALLSLVLLPALPAQPLAEDDAGSGGDAGGSFEEATRLAAYGTYEGFLWLGDRDWYAVADSATGIRCVEATVHGAGFWNATLVLLDPSPRLRTATTSLDPTEGETSAGLASPTHALGALGIGPDRASPLADGTPGPYTFALRAFDAASIQGDGGAALDAPSETGLAPPAGLTCTGGRAPSGDVDVYRVTYAPGDRLTVSFAATSHHTTLRLLDSDGAVGPVLRSGDVLQVNATEHGVAYLQVEQSGSLDASYFVGLARDDRPPGQSCRPYCLGGV